MSGSRRWPTRLWALVGLVVLAVGFVAVAAGAYAWYSHWVGGATYSLDPTQRCLRRHGFVVQRALSDEPHARELNVSRRSSKPDPYPNVYFFESRADARDFAQGDSVPLVRRANVVLDFENYDQSADSDPAVRALTRCLRRG